MIVDEMHATHPELVKDAYWDDILPDVLPHGDAAPMKKNEVPAFAGSFRDLTTRNKLLAPSMPPTPDPNLILNDANRFPDFNHPVILKRPPLYKRFLSNTVQMDEESRGGELKRRDPLSVSQIS